jgi:segregation and condensation protein A
MDAGTAAPVIEREGEGASPHLALDGFAGELAVLLSLARTHAIDLARLSLSDCIRQVASTLEQTGPLAQKADWLVMAAWLVLLRSRLLLPTIPDAEVSTSLATDADRQDVRGREVPVAQALAAWLDRRPQLGIDVFARGQPELLGTELGLRYQVDVVEFLWACLALFEDPDGIDGTEVYRPLWHDLCSVLDARARVLRLLPEASAEAPLTQFLPDIAPAADEERPARIALRQRSAVASTLLAGLELARESAITRVPGQGAIRSRRVYEGRRN